MSTSTVEHDARLVHPSWRQFAFVQSLGASEVACRQYMPAHTPQALQSKQLEVLPRFSRYGTLVSRFQFGVTVKGS